DLAVRALGVLAAGGRAHHTHDLESDAPDLHAGADRIFARREQLVDRAAGNHGHLAAFAGVERVEEAAAHYQHGSHLLGLGGAADDLEASVPLTARHRDAAEVVARRQRGDAGDAAPQGLHVGVVEGDEAPGLEAAVRQLRPLRPDEDGVGRVAAD